MSCPLVCRCQRRYSGDRECQRAQRGHDLRGHGARRPLGTQNPTGALRYRDGKQDAAVSLLFSLSLGLCLSLSLLLFSVFLSDRVFFSFRLLPLVSCACFSGMSSSFFLKREDLFSCVHSFIRLLPNYPSRTLR